MNMKALELAKKLEGYHFEEDCDMGEIMDAAAELRLLAEVNAELLGALEVSRNTLQYYASVCNEDDQETPAKYAIARIDNESAKAKEQQ
jgi:hypothetical protein